MIAAREHEIACGKTKFHCHGIVAVTIIDDFLARNNIETISIIARAAAQGILPVTAIQHIIAGAAKQRVRAGAA